MRRCVLITTCWSPLLLVICGQVFEKSVYLRKNFTWSNVVCCFCCQPSADGAILTNCGKYMKCKVNEQIFVHISLFLIRNASYCTKFYEKTANHVCSDFVRLTMQANYKS